MNKAELLQAMVEKTGGTKKDAEANLNAFIETVMETVKEKESVQLVGFGTFTSKDRKARTGRNPRNPSETIEIPASTAPAFKPGKAFKDAVK